MPETPVPSLDVAAIRARAEAATPGPWESDGDYDRAEVCQVGDSWSLVVGTEDAGHGYGVYTRLVLSGADSQFVAHARTDVPALLAALEAAEAERELWAWLLAEQRHLAHVNAFHWANTDVARSETAQVANTFRAERDEARAALARIEALRDRVPTDRDIDASLIPLGFHPDERYPEWSHNHLRIAYREGWEDAADAALRG